MIAAIFDCQACTRVGVPHSGLTRNLRVLSLVAGICGSLLYVMSCLIAPLQIDMYGCFEELSKDFFQACVYIYISSWNLFVMR